MTQAQTKKQKLSQAYTFKGKAYGPGKSVEVPEDFPDVERQEKEHAARMEARADTTVSLTEQGLGVREDAVEKDGTVVPMVSGEIPEEVPPVEPPVEGGGETPPPPEDFAGMSKDELADIAAQRGVSVKRANGGSGEPTKADYVAALEADAAKRKK